MVASAVLAASLTQAAGPPAQGPVEPAPRRYNAVDLGPTIAGLLGATSWVVCDYMNASGQVAGWFEKDGTNRAFFFDGATAHDIGAVDGGAFPTGLNDRGHVAGTYMWRVSSNGVLPRGFVWTGGAPVDVGRDSLSGINAQGHAVGRTLVGTDPSTWAWGTFVWDGGIHMLPPFLGGGEDPHDINDLGQITGGAISEIGANGIEHAFRFSNGVYEDLSPGVLRGARGVAINNGGTVVGSLDGIATVWAVGSPPQVLPMEGYTSSHATDINNLGEVLANLGGAQDRGYIWDGTTMRLLRTLVEPGDGNWHLRRIRDAKQINDAGQILVDVFTEDHQRIVSCVRLDPVQRVRFVNPFATSVGSQRLPTSLDNPSQVSNAPAATGLAADGAAAAVVVLQSVSNSPVALDLEAVSPDPLRGSFGSLSAYDPNYLLSPDPRGGTQLVLASPAAGNATDGYTFLALLWAPPTMPVTQVDLLGGTFKQVPLRVRATQGGIATLGSISLQPPPLLLVHGVWSDARQAWTSFLGHLEDIYYPAAVRTVDYGRRKTPEGFSLSAKSFDDAETQAVFRWTLLDALTRAAESGIAVRRVDVVAHSMGALVTRYFVGSSPGPRPFLPANPVHRLISIGTPHAGSALAVQLELHKDDLSTGGSGLITQAICLHGGVTLGECTLKKVLGLQGREVDTAIPALADGLAGAQLPFSAVVGHQPPVSVTYVALNQLVNAFIPGLSINDILGSPQNDTVVAGFSQAVGACETALVTDIVHANIGDAAGTGETENPSVWSHVLHWLMGGGSPSCQGTISALGDTPAPVLLPPAVPPVVPSADPLPTFDLTGYTEVASANASVTPGSGTALTANVPIEIVATSATKTIREVWLFQTVAEPSDQPLLYDTSAPFAIPFTPTRLGTARLTAFVLFTDQTFTAFPLAYTLAPAGVLLDLRLIDAPTASQMVNTHFAVGVQAHFPDGPVEVTSLATYQQRSGGASVFSIAPGGVITAEGAGSDWLDVSYGGSTTSARISVVGACAFQLTPGTVEVGKAAGVYSLSLATTAGCGWAASSNVAWLTVNGPGAGVGAAQMSYSVSANTTGSARTATITAAGLSATITQLNATPFVDDVLIPGVTAVRAVHITELRARIDALRGAAGLGGYFWANPVTSGLLIRAQHIVELRAALNDVYAAAPMMPPAYTDPALAAGAPIRAVHIAELRAAVLALE